MAQMPRMTGAVTGNFGRAKVKTMPGTYELSKRTLTKQSLRIPRPDDVMQRYMDAYNNTDDPKLQKFLMETIRDYYNKRIQHV
jgi:hypothetical protein